MPVTGTYADGAMQFASQSAQISGVTYVFEKISIKHTQRRLLQRDQNGIPAKKTHIVDLTEGTATLQFPTTTAPSPPRFATFSLVPAGGGTALNFIVEEVSEVFDHEQEAKCDITFSLQLAGAVPPNE